MPAFLLAVPAAAALAWWLLKGGPMRRRPRSGGPTGDAGDGLGPGETARLRPGEEDDPFKRDELPFERGVPSFTGGEYGDGYGPQAGDGGDGSMFADAPSPTQTALMTPAGAADSPLGLPPGGDYGGYVPGSGQITDYSAGSGPQPTVHGGDFVQPSPYGTLSGAPTIKVAPTSTPIAM